MDPGPSKLLQWVLWVRFLGQLVGLLGLVLFYHFFNTSFFTGVELSVKTLQGCNVF